MPKPIKAQLPTYIEMEDKLHKVIAEKFKLTWPMPSSVKDIDTRMLVTERDQLLSTITEVWDPWKDIVPLNVEVVPTWTPELAKLRFFERFHKFKTCGRYQSMV